MARPTGFNKGMRGKLGNQTTYMLNGKEVTRTIGNVDKEMLHHSENYAGTRENWSEFTIGSNTAKVLRGALLPYKEKWFGPQLHGRLSGIFRSMVGLGKGEKGKRSLEVEHFGLLHRSPLHKLKPKRAFFCMGDPLAIDQQSLSVSLYKNMLELEDIFGIKLREYHKVVIGAVLLSEIHHSGEGYEILQPDLHGVAAYAVAESLPVGKPEAPVRLEAGMEAGAIPEGVGLIGVVGVM